MQYLLIFIYVNSIVLEVRLSIVVCVHRNFEGYILENKCICVNRSIVLCDLHHYLI